MRVLNLLTFFPLISLVLFSSASAIPSEALAARQESSSLVSSIPVAGQLLGDVLGPDDSTGNATGDSGIGIHPAPVVDETLKLISKSKLTWHAV